MNSLLIWGFVGGILPDILRAISHRYDGAPTYFRSWFFWVCFVLLGALGSGLVYWLGATDIKTALSIGFTGPEIVRRLLGGKAGPDPDQDAPRFAPAKPNAWQAQRQWWSS